MPNPVWLDTLGFIHVKKVIVNNFKVQLNATIHNLIKFCFWFSQRRVFLLVMLSMYKVELLWFLPWTIKPPEFSVLPNFLNWCLGVKVWRPDLLFCQLSTNRFCTEQTAGYIADFQSAMWSFDVFWDEFWSVNLWNHRISFKFCFDIGLGTILLINYVSEHCVTPVIQAYQARENVIENFADMFEKLVLMLQTGCDPYEHKFSSVKLVRNVVIWCFNGFKTYLSLN